MIRTLGAAVLLLTAPAAAAHEPLPTIDDPAFARSLAAGYKALMRCGALANQRPAAWMRGPQSVDAMELDGIYPELQPLLPATAAQEIRGEDGQISYVTARHGPSGPERFAVYRRDKGCALAPAGAKLSDLPRLFPAMTMVERSAPVIGPPPPPGFAPRRLEPLKAALAGGYGERARTTAVIVTRNGKQIDGGYAPGFGHATPQRTWSVAKSMAATLVGGAVQRGEVAVGDSAGLGVGPDDPRRKITIDHLLRMASGRTSDTAGNRSDALYFGGYSVEDTALHWPLVASPGSTFRYANNDTLAAVRAIAPTFATHPPRDLFRLLGMFDTVAETDWKGHYVLSSQVWSTANDLARLGQLYLQNGVWKGRRVLPDNWLAYVSRPSGPQPEGEFGYGAGFWLFDKSPGVPTDTIAMQGNRGQYVVVVPSRQVVIVRRGEDPAGSRFDIAGFTRDVLAALER
jgi:CubicO group peptidase (beta-lactamase class C family)